MYDIHKELQPEVSDEKVDQKIFQGLAEGNKKKHQTYTGQDSLLAVNYPAVEEAVNFQ